MRAKQPLEGTHEQTLALPQRQVALEQLETRALLSVLGVDPPPALPAETAPFAEPLPAIIEPIVEAAVIIEAGPSEAGLTEKPFEIPIAERSDSIAIGDLGPAAQLVIDNSDASLISSDSQSTGSTTQRHEGEFFESMDVIHELSVSLNLDLSPSSEEMVLLNLQLPELAEPVAAPPADPLLMRDGAFVDDIGSDAAEPTVLENGDWNPVDTDAFEIETFELFVEQLAVGPVALGEVGIEDSAFVGLFEFADETFANVATLEPSEVKSGGPDFSMSLLWGVQPVDAGFIEADAISSAFADSALGTYIEIATVELLFDGLSIESDSSGIEWIGATILDALAPVDSDFVAASVSEFLATLEIVGPAKLSGLVAATFEPLSLAANALESVLQPFDGGPLSIAATLAGQIVEAATTEIHTLIAETHEIEAPEALSITGLEIDPAPLILDAVESTWLDIDWIETFDPTTSFDGLPPTAIDLAPIETLVLSVVESVDAMAVDAMAIDLVDEIIVTPALEMPLSTAWDEVFAAIDALETAALFEMPLKFAIETTFDAMNFDAALQMALDVAAALQESIALGILAVSDSTLTLASDLDLASELAALSQTVLSLDMAATLTTASLFDSVFGPQLLPTESLETISDAVVDMSISSASTAESLSTVASPSVVFTVPMFALSPALQANTIAWAPATLAVAESAVDTELGQAAATTYQAVVVSPVVSNVTTGHTADEVADTGEWIGVALEVSNAPTNAVTTSNISAEDATAQPTGNAVSSDEVELGRIASDLESKAEERTEAGAGEFVPTPVQGVELVERGEESAAIVVTAGVLGVAFTRPLSRVSGAAPVNSRRLGAPAGSGVFIATAGAQSRRRRRTPDLDVRHARAAAWSRAKPLDAMDDIGASTSSSEVSSLAAREAVILAWLAKRKDDRDEAHSIDRVSRGWTTLLKLGGLAAIATWFGRDRLPGRRADSRVRPALPSYDGPTRTR